MCVSSQRDLERTRNELTRDVKMLREEVDLERQGHEQAKKALAHAKAEAARRSDQLETLLKSTDRWRNGVYATRPHRGCGRGEFPRWARAGRRRLGGLGRDATCGRGDIGRPSAALARGRAAGGARTGAHAHTQKDKRCSEDSRPVGAQTCVWRFLAQDALKNELGGVRRQLADREGTSRCLDRVAGNWQRPLPCTPARQCHANVNRGGRSWRRRRGGGGGSRRAWYDTQAAHRGSGRS